MLPNDRKFLLIQTRFFLVPASRLLSTNSRRSEYQIGSSWHWKAKVNTMQKKKKIPFVKKAIHFMPSWGTSAQFAITATIPRSFSLPPASSDQLAVVPTANVDLDDHATATFACAKMAAVPVDRAVCRYHIAVALGSYRPRQVVYAKGTKLTLASLMFLKIRLRSQRICLWTTSSRCSLRLLVLLLGFDRHMF